LPDTLSTSLQQAGAELCLARTEIREGRFQRSMAIITTFSAIVGGFEAYAQHRRGAFRNPLMWTPVWLTGPVVASAGAALLSETAAHRLLPLSAIAALIDGLVGFVYHIKGIDRRPGGFKLGRYNIVMGPPVFAPLLLGITGLLGLLASMLRRETLDKAEVEAETIGSVLLPAPRTGDPLRTIEFAVSHGRFQKLMAAATAILAALAGGEAYFEHLRGSYNSAVMSTPVLLTPPMMVAAIGSVASERTARHVLPAASAVIFADGALGFFLHLRGLFRMPGSMRNVSFNITYGPPMFAPLLFCATGLLGIIASLLGRRKA
jgi:hypothetical protein